MNENFPKRDCNQYFICLTDIDWRPEHCKNCHQYEPSKTHDWRCKCPKCEASRKAESDLNEMKMVRR